MFRCSIAVLALLVSLAVAWVLGLFKKGDGTAQGVAKARHMESIYPIEGTEKRLFQDPYAHYFYAGSAVVPRLFEWVSPKALFGMFGDFNAGVQWTLIGRTREFDEQVRAGIAAGVTQYVVLGAGYDTRSLRLGLPEDVKIFEVDQPKVQAMKQAKLDAIPGLTIPSNVHFVPIDFNVDDVSKLRKHQAYDPAAPTLFTLEGVSQYIPAQAVESTVATAAAMSGNKSRILISYVPQDLYDAPEARSLLFLARYIAQEPWITGWHKQEFTSLMKAHGFRVKRDVSLPELHEDFFVPAGRSLPKKQQVILERYVTAIKE